MKRKKKSRGPVGGGSGREGGITVDVNKERIEVIVKIPKKGVWKYFSHHRLTADTSFKFLALILFKIWHF